MKANEAPEKLYIDLFNGEFNVSYSPANNSIEYVHTDAFIEKAAEWIDETLRNTDFYENEIELMINDFKKAMKYETKN